MRWLDSFSDNRKSKIQNRKLVGFVALAVPFVICGAVARRSRQGKSSAQVFWMEDTASGMAVLNDAFRQEMSKLGWIERKNITVEYVFGARPRHKHDSGTRQRSST